ncbi:metal-dependent hydrolase [Cellulosimicrobium sp. Marseille-Q4280]|uniref:metal-dependent hydrolase n=1 Tax=Cellulosimicrobium sp. Marseille-Q4280 TaxID=2937992 RepID=UPI00204199DE|nr:metal-dependent hydrolase [Cellulosimicrobium sp. Marseille-Q4280]
MMGTHHAVSGAAAWLAVTSTAPWALGLHPMSTRDQLVGAVLAAGAAILPDADHHNGTIAHSGGVVTKVAARTVEAASGGHRHGLHSLLAIIGFYLGATYLGTWWATVPVLGYIPAGSTLLWLALIGFTLKVLKLSKGGVIKLWVTAALATLPVLYFFPDLFEILPTVVVVGVITHLVGDFLTVGGLPLLWPWIPKPPKGLDYVPIVRSIWQQNGYVALPILGKTGSMREMALFAVLSLYTLVALADTIARAVGAPLPIPGIGA